MMWMKYASCRGLPVELFMPKRGEMSKIKEARKICGDCPVIDSCRQYSVDASQWTDLDGIFGGWTKNERRKHMRTMGLTVRRTGSELGPMPTMRRTVVKIHGTATAYRKHLADNEQPCQECSVAHEERKYRIASRERKAKYG